jgi:hypothetical protein
MSYDELKIFSPYLTLVRLRGADAKDTHPYRHHEGDIEPADRKTPG